MDRDRNGRDDRDELREIAEQAMQARGFVPYPDEKATQQANQTQEISLPRGNNPRGNQKDTNSLSLAGLSNVRDLTDWPWTSIDNDDSKDLDQLEVSFREKNYTRILVAIAEVDHVCPEKTPIDLRAAQNTTSVYTAAGIFPMLPARLSEDFTSLLPEKERLAAVTELHVTDDGKVVGSEHFPAVVKNYAKLTYDSVSAWLEGSGPLPPALNAREDLVEQVRMQDRVAQALRRVRFEQGALGLDNGEPRPVRDKAGKLVDFAMKRQTRAGGLVEDLMIAVNQAVARYLEAKGFPSLRRAVRTPERWERIVSLGKDWGYILPSEPSPKALARFLESIKRAHPEDFEDVSVAVVKLVGRGEYVGKKPGESPPGHFGLAVPDYAHSTAPNRRYPDVVVQRLLKMFGWGILHHTLLSNWTSLVVVVLNKQGMHKKLNDKLQNQRVRSCWQVGKVSAFMQWSQGSLQRELG